MDFKIPMGAVEWCHIMAVAPPSFDARILYPEIFLLSLLLVIAGDAGSIWIYSMMIRLFREVVPA